MLDFKTGPEGISISTLENNCYVTVLYIYAVLTNGSLKHLRNKKIVPLLVSCLIHTAITFNKVFSQESRGWLGNQYLSEELKLQFDVFWQIGPFQAVLKLL